MTESSKVTVVRHSCLANQLRAYRLLVDGKEVARLKNAETVTIEVAPGTHELVAKVDWIRSRPLVFEAASGGAMIIDCSTNGNPIQLLKAAVGLASSHIVLDSRGPRDLSVDVVVEPEGSRAARLRKAALWLVGSISIGLGAALLINAMTATPGVADRLANLIGQLSGFVGILGAMWIAMRGKPPRP